MRNIHFLYNRLSAQNTDYKRQREILLNHGEKAAGLLLVAISIDDGFLDQRFQLRLAERGKVGFRSLLRFTSIHMAAFRLHFIVFGEIMDV